jgi:hypothetical protein
MEAPQCGLWLKYHVIIWFVKQGGPFAPFILARWWLILFVLATPSERQNAEHKLSQMTPPGDLQSYDPAPTGHAEKQNSTWKDIEGEDDNMLVKLERPQLRREFEAYLQDHTTEIQDIVSHHLSLKQHQHCTVAEQSSWMYGDFNACIPITVSNWRTQRLLLRCPFPHMLSGSHTTDKADEKVRCEAATFTWISQNCTQVPVPRLWGFGLPGGLRVRREEIYLKNHG